MTDAISIKQPDTNYDLHPLIQKRWSPRSFSDKNITKAQMLELLEAARWSASANNEQPWQYVYALRGTEGFEAIWSTLLPGNQPWTKQAAALLISVQRNTFNKTGKPNLWAMHDVGMANSQLLLQATHRDIYGHMMAGFDKEKVQNLLQLDEQSIPVCVIALGYLGPAEALEEPYKTRELTARSRQPLNTFIQEL